MSKTMLIQILLLMVSLNLIAEIVISPTRIVFDKGKTQEQISITNNGSDTLYFSLSFIQYAMTEQGGLELLNNSDNNDFAHSFIRVYPRSLKLSPLETQKIRLQFVPSAHIEEKEYRSHLFFEALNIKNANEQTAGKVEALQIAITPLYNFSIPVFIRNTKEKPVCEINQFELISENGADYVRFFIYRQGTASTYGDIYVDFFSSDGKSYTIAQTLGVAIYTNIGRRYFKLPLDVSDVKNLNGTFRIRYVADDNETEVYAINEFKI